MHDPRPPPYCACVRVFLIFRRTSFRAELMFLETSALTGENVEEGFLKCARTILNKIDSGTAFAALHTRLRSHLLSRWEYEELPSSMGEEMRKMQIFFGHFFPGHAKTARRTCV